MAYTRYTLLVLFTPTPASAPQAATHEVSERASVEPRAGKHGRTGVSNLIGIPSYRGKVCATTYAEE